MQQLRRSGLLIANASRATKSPVGAAPSASMPLRRSFGFLPFAVYMFDSLMASGFPNSATA